MAGNQKAPQKLRGKSGRPCTWHSIMTTRGVQVASDRYHVVVLSRGRAVSCVSINLVLGAAKGVGMPPDLCCLSVCLQTEAMFALGSWPTW